MELHFILQVDLGQRTRVSGVDIYLPRYRNSSMSAYMLKYRETNDTGEWSEVRHSVVQSPRIKRMNYQRYNFARCRCTHH